MNARERGTVISLHAYGGTVRLEDGRIATIPLTEIERDRSAYDRAFATRRHYEFAVDSQGSHPVASLAPQIDDPELDQQITQWIKSTEDWTTPEGPPAHERHFLRKKRRAALFESHHTTE